MSALFLVRFPRDRATIVLAADKAAARDRVETTQRIMSVEQLTPPEVREVLLTGGYCGWHMGASDLAEARRKIAVQILRRVIAVSSAEQLTNGDGTPFVLDPRPAQALAVYERYIAGEASAEELRAAHLLAYESSETMAYSAVGSAAAWCGCLLMADAARAARGNDSDDKHAIAQLLRYADCCGQEKRQ